jgi:hypothetical protein
MKKVSFQEDESVASFKRRKSESFSDVHCSQKEEEPSMKPRDSSGKGQEDPSLLSRGESGGQNDDQDIQEERTKEPKVEQQVNHIQIEESKKHQNE